MTALIFTNPDLPADETLAKVRCAHCGQAVPLAAGADGVLRLAAHDLPAYCELAGACEGANRAIGRIDLILTNANEPPHPGVVPELVEQSPPEKESCGLADGAYHTLRLFGVPMSCMKMAKTALTHGFRPDLTPDRLRSAFAAVISKEMRSSKSRFVRLARGSIGLVEWLDAAGACPAGGRGIGRLERQAAGE